MLGIVGAAIIITVLGVLAVMPKMSDHALPLQFMAPCYMEALSAILILTIIGLVMTNRLTHAALRRVVQTTLALLTVFLFALRAMVAYDDFEQLAIKAPHTVTATVHIDEISDSIYDDVLGVSYRQRAILKDIRHVDSLHQTVRLANPFYSPKTPSLETATQPVGNRHLPKQMVVLLRSDARTAKYSHQLNQLSPNTHARMTLQLRPISTKKSADGFDANAWLHTRQIHAIAHIMSIDDISSSDRVSMTGRLQAFRQILRNHFYHNWHDNDVSTGQAKAVALSLLTGDRALITRETKELYQLAGISHLLAISGTHVVFLAVMLAGLTTMLIDKLCPGIYMTWARWQIRLVLMVIVSVMYAVFTGFDVPAVRTVYMLFAMALARYLVLPMSNLAMLLLVGMVMIWLDPYVLWQAGFWLSFVAVLLLMKYEAVLVQSVPTNLRFWHRVKQMVWLQVWLFIAMLPVSWVFFGKVSLWGILVNLFAVGLFGAVIVPINLLGGMVFVVLPAIADGIWAVSFGILTRLHTAFELFLLGDSWLYAPFGVLGLILCVLVLLPMLNKSLPKFAMLLPLTVLVFLLIDKGLMAHDEKTVVLKVMPTDHQALQVVLIKNDKQAWLLLADFGVGASAVSQTTVLIDGMRRQGVRSLTGVIVQTPGTTLPKMVADIHAKIPILHYWQAGRSPLTLNGLVMQECQAGKIYQMDGLSLRALTGWQQIADERVWGCGIEMVSQYPIRLDKTNTQDWQDFDEMPDDAPKDIHRVIVNAATHDNAWQLWRWICQDDDALIAPKATTHDAKWLSHPLASHDDDVRQKFMATPW